MKETHKRVLNWINRIRESLGLKPRKTIAKGLQYSDMSCPIANSIPVDVRIRYDEISFDTRNAEKVKENFSDYETYTHCVFLIPQYITDWIYRFDKGVYPEFMLNKGE